MRDKVAAILEMIRLDMKVEGGDVELVDVKDGVVSVKLIGGLYWLQHARYYHEIWYRAHSQIGIA